MKQNLVSEDLADLTETQKSALRDLWHPCKYDLAVEIVWRDVENDLFDSIVLMVDDVRVQEMGSGGYTHCVILLKVLYLDNPPSHDNLAMETEDEEDDDENSFDDDMETNSDPEMEVDLEYEAEDPSANEININKEHCLPLLSVGQMIEILENNKSNLELAINFSPEEVVCFIDGKVFCSEELCDALWSAVKTLL